MILTRILTKRQVSQSEVKENKIIMIIGTRIRVDEDYWLIDNNNIR
jgi:hypothetical protein